MVVLFGGYGTSLWGVGDEGGMILFYGGIRHILGWYGKGGKELTYCCV